jgi:integrase
MLAFSGMRSGEAQGLKRASMNLKDGWLDILDQVDGPTKTASSVRSVPIHPRLLKLLMALPKHEHELFFVAEPSGKYPDGGQAINTKRLNEYFKAAASRAGIEGFTCHSLRHFFKTFCINAGVPREMVDRWQGHTDGSVSGRYYHVHDSKSKQFMDSVLFEKGGDE